MKRRVAVRGIIEKNGTILAAQLKPYKDSITAETAYWCTPGGGVDEGEDLRAAVQREIIEELGVTPVVGNLLYVQQFIQDEKEQLEFFFHITNTADFELIDLSATSHGEVEIARLEFIKPAESVLLPKFLQTEDIAGAIASNAPTQFFYYN